MALSTSPAKHPSKDVPLRGTDIALIGLAPHHAPSLFPLCSDSTNAHLWTYMPLGPYDTANAETVFSSDIRLKADSKDPLFYAIVSNQDPEQVLGHASLMRIDPSNRVVEIGHVLFTAALQKTRAATEVFYLLFRYAFDDLGFRRLEWKCDALNEPSRKAAQRLGLVFEGVFRQHMIVKGKNRDTAWFAMLDGEWPVMRKGLEGWLEEGNFDQNGKQRKSLREMREASLQT
ncbi:MAG: hypothetical protein M1821_001377 [Bathelium mastoideum]|nr:MAG: hypothetical protein M1821_001377 [Bathelium mastoideum]